MGLLQSTEALGSSQVIIDEAKRTCQELAVFLRSGKHLPSWQPECPFSAVDEELARRLDEAVDSLEAARNRLHVKKGALLLAAKWATPFKCDRRIEDEIKSLDRLCELSKT